ncbi:glutaminyl-peptide cyclotransferase-like [Babylonia areolata]|uniref:glutaminyl-peptide cyclotransferase-like n=1 Tax=Babylonia areolata TaxID=304850 RepID=UPI003FD023BF
MGGQRFGLSSVTCLLLLLQCYHGQTAPKARPLRPVTSEEALRYLTDRMSDMDTFRHDMLDPMLIERVSDTPGNKKVREHIIKNMQNLGWTVEEDSFEQNTPFGNKRFVNIIATLNPGRSRRTVVACHYDSKDMQTKERKTFIGAIDSAVPCAIMMETARQLDCLLTKARAPDSNAADADLTLQYVFFDGEEAFDHWTSTDSIYGARHLAGKWEKNSLSSIRELILLDLIGTTDTQFMNLFPSTSSLYSHLVQTETQLRSGKHLTEGHTKTMFQDVKTFRGIEDDHIPFLRRGVDILHLISVPFPSVWHKVEDDGQHLDFAFIDNFSRVFRVFTSALMHLEPENNACRK